MRLERSEVIVRQCSAAESFEEFSTGSVCDYSQHCPRSLMKTVISLISLLSFAAFAQNQPAASAAPAPAPTAEGAPPPTAGNGTMTTATPGGHGTKKAKPFKGEAAPDVATPAPAPAKAGPKK